jgi:succinylglutamate desuccinylase
MNFSAEVSEELLATAVTVWTMLLAPRVEGGIRMSLTKVRAMPPVAGGGCQ